mmetsp:Transcript_28671/g.66107  ORF Transcript_28671/g.66107 Transcript_28671/m.66107 type:complete len:259 (+) Transcript_28671:45-821(+)
MGSGSSARVAKPAGHGVETGKEPCGDVCPQTAKDTKPMISLLEDGAEPIVMCGPSGAGKSTLYRSLITMELPNVRFRKGIQDTTRKLRAGEEDGKDYRFVSREAFDMNRKEENYYSCGIFERKCGDCYGLPSHELRADYDEHVQKYVVPILDIDVDRAHRIRQELRSKGHFVFILPPSVEALQQRLEGRKDMIEAGAKESYSRERMDYGFKECMEALRHKESWDLVLTNDDECSACGLLKQKVTEWYANLRPPAGVVA